MYTSFATASVVATLLFSTFTSASPLTARDPANNFDPIFRCDVQDNAPKYVRAEQYPLLKHCINATTQFPQVGQLGFATLRRAFAAGRCNLKFSQVPGTASTSIAWSLVNTMVERMLIACQSEKIVRTTGLVEVGGLRVETEKLRTGVLGVTDDDDDKVAGNEEVQGSVEDSGQVPQNSTISLQGQTS